MEVSKQQAVPEEAVPEEGQQREHKWAAKYGGCRNIQLLRNGTHVSAQGRVARTRVYSSHVDVVIAGTDVWFRIGLHLDLATSNIAVQECARLPGEVLPELFPTQAPFQDGFLLAPDRPGLGIEFNEEAVKLYPPVAGDCPRLSRPDGAFTNW